MAATIAKAFGGDSTREKAVHRLGSLYSRAEANTWRTFVTAFVKKDGSGYVEVRRNGKTIHEFEFGAE